MSSNQNIYDEFSRYYHLLEKLDLDVLKGKNVPGMLKDVEFPESEQDVYHITNHGDLINLERLSFHYYGEAKLWWVIAIANNILDPFDDDDTGLTLRIPAYSTVKQVLDECLQR
jgi:nucleoid-associated protein YgaU